MNGLWLDDERPMPGGFTHHARTAQEAIDLLKTVRFDRVSLDHDLGEGNGTGYDVARFIEEEAYFGRLPRMTLMVHSKNSVGREKIRTTLNNAYRFWRGTRAD